MEAGVVKGVITGAGVGAAGGDFISQAKKETKKINIFFMKNLFTAKLFIENLPHKKEKSNILKAFSDFLQFLIENKSGNRIYLNGFSIHFGITPYHAVNYTFLFNNHAPLDRQYPNILLMIYKETSDGL